MLLGHAIESSRAGSRDRRNRGDRVTRAIAALDPGIADAVEWLVFSTSSIATPAELLHGFARHLEAAGHELLRINVQVRPLSPDVGALLYIWRSRARHLELSREAKI